VGSCARTAGLCTRLLLFIAAFAGVARAEPNAGAREAARTMMDRGHALRKAGDHRGALVQFQAAEEIMHLPITGLETAREEIALGQLVEALDMLEQVGRMPVSPHEPDILRESRDAAASLLPDLSMRIPVLKVTVTGVPPGTAIGYKVDGLAIPEPTLLSPLRVNPGHHVVVGSALGVSAAQSVDVQEGQSVGVVLTFPEPPPRPASASPSPASATSATSATNATDTTSGAPPTVRTLRWVGVGVAAAGVVVGTVSGILSVSATNAATGGGCVSDRCPPSTWDDIQRAKTTGNISTAAFITAGAGAALAITTLFIRGSSATPSANGQRNSSGHMTLSVVPGGMSLAGEF
jgi:hypothetical protein